MEAEPTDTPVARPFESTLTIPLFDEVQAGMGRTGKLFAYQHYGVQPDIITLAKSLGGGFPIGMMLARREVAEAFEFGNHASTFGGGEFVTGIAIAFLEILFNDNLLDHVVEMGNLLFENLKKLKEKYPTLIRETRGIGLMAGLQFNDSTAAADGRHYPGISCHWSECDFCTNQVDVCKKAAGV